MRIVQTGILVLSLILSVAVQAFPQTQPAPPEQPPQPPQQPGPQPPQEPAPQEPVPQEPAPQAAPTPPPTKIIPGASIAGVQLGGSVRALHARLGLPSEVVEQAGFAAHLYGRLGLVVYVRGNVIAAVATTNSLFRIGGSLGVGQRIADVRVEFGGASRQGMLGGFRADLYDDRGIGFGIDRDSIVIIIIFRPGEARLVSAL